MFSANTFHLIDHQFNSTSSCIYGTDFDPLIQINTFETLDDLKSWLLNLSYQAIEFIDKHKQKVRRNFVDKARIKEAEKLLINSPDKIYKIAESVGFRDSHYFGIVFKKITGLSPSEYRDKVRLNGLSLDRQAVT